MARYLRLIFPLVFLTIIATAALASNFGSSTKGDSLTLKENESGVFTLLFWTTENTSRTVNLNEISVPANLFVTMEKNEFNLSNKEGNELIYEAGGSIRATSVKIFVSQLEEKPGNYSIVLAATYSTPEETTKQERTFNLAVNVEGNKTPPKTGEDNSPMSYVIIGSAVVGLLALRRK